MKVRGEPKGSPPFYIAFPIVICHLSFFNTID